jgi:hypothetical protein
MAPSASSMPCSSGNSAGHAMVGRVSAGTSRRRAHGSTPRCPISREVCQRLQPSPALPPCRLQLVHNVFRRVVVREDTPPRRACMQCAYTLHPTALLTPQRYTPLRRRGLNGDPCEGRDASTPLPLTVCSLAACTGRASQRSSLAASSQDYACAKELYLRASTVVGGGGGGGACGRPSGGTPDVGSGDLGADPYPCGVRHLAHGVDVRPRRQPQREPCGPPALARGGGGVEQAVHAKQPGRRRGLGARDGAVERLVVQHVLADVLR